MRWGRSFGFSRELARHRVPHEFISIPQGGHGLGGADQDVVEAAHTRARAFIKGYLKKQSPVPKPE